MKFFKGFVPTKDKKCLLPFKNKSSAELKTLSEVEDLSEYAGILSDETILIDVDDARQSDILLDIVDDLNIRCRVYQTTRGKHFLFKNIDSDGQYIQPTNKIKTKLTCGLSADIKVGCKNSYSILKYADRERPIIYDILEGEEYEALPKWLLPVKTSYNFLKMSEGDGRNQTLFNYILTLQKLDMSTEDIRQTLRILNKYVLPEPLDDSELETILRDESFSKPVFFSSGGTFLFDKFAQYLKANNHIVKINGILHIYHDGIYEYDPHVIEAEMIRHIPNLNRAKRAEVLSYLELLTLNGVNVSDANLIAFNNGVYDIDSDEFTDFSSDYIITNKIPFDYVPEAYNELTDRTLDKLACNDPVIRQLLEELIGYVMYRQNMRKAFILIGDKANGKSSYLDMIKTMLGERNITTLDLGELADRFKTAELFGKLACIGDDIGDEFIPNPAVFKKLVSGEGLNAERKGKDPFDFNNYAKLLFSANDIPRIKDKSGAVIDRLVIIPFNARFSKEDPDYDPYIRYKLRKRESMEYLIQIGLKALKRVLENKGFTISTDVEKALEDYEENNNPILLFFKDDPKIENEPTNDVYKQYSLFCRSNGFNAMSKVEFSKQVKKRLGYEIVDKKRNGKKYRVFVQSYRN